MARLLCAVLAVVLATAGSSAASANGGVRIGTLTCQVAAGAGFIVGSRKTLACRFDGNSGVNERYTGSITKLGVDLGGTTSSAIVWAVFAPTSDFGPGALEGGYYGVSAEVTPGVGVGANVLIGGFDKSINLQPLSVSGQLGANVAAGISGMRLRSAPADTPVIVRKP